MFTALLHIKDAIERLTAKPKNFSVVEVQTLLVHRSLPASDKSDLEDMLFSDENASEA